MNLDEVSDILEMDPSSIETFLEDAILDGVRMVLDD